MSFWQDYYVIKIPVNPVLGDAGSTLLANDKALMDYVRALLPLTGGTLTGNLYLGNNELHVGDVTIASEIAQLLEISSGISLNHNSSNTFTVIYDDLLFIEMYRGAQDTNGNLILQFLDGIYVVSADDSGNYHTGISYMMSFRLGGACLYGYDGSGSGGGSGIGDGYAIRTDGGSINLGFGNIDTVYQLFAQELYAANGYSGDVTAGQTMHFVSGILTGVS